MNYNQAIAYLYQLSSLGWKLGLNKIRALLQEINDPHQKYQVIHIAGTNGKGSTSAITESILRAAGYKTGLFISPHLVDIRERIQCNGENISKNELLVYIKKLKPLIEKYRCTFFEAMTAIAFVYFADKQIDVAVIEVGLGGRLDATNVVNPTLSIITDIEHDHTRLLGRSRHQIAIEKGGIIKEGVPCLTISRHQSVIDTLSQICAERNAELIEVAKLIEIESILQNEKFTSFDLRVNGSIYPQLKLSLLGEHQIKNATLAIAACNFLNLNHLNITTEDIYHGLHNVHWQGRLQILGHKPKFVVDVAHNPNGVSKLIESIQTIFSYRNLLVVLGISKNKNYSTMIKLISSIADRMIIVKPEARRTMDSKILAKAASTHGVPVETFENVKDGVNSAIGKAGNDDLILGTGSHYTVGEIISLYNKQYNETTAI